MRVTARKMIMMTAVPAAALLALACGRGRDDRARAADDELRSDIALAATDGLELAPSANTGTISALEAGPPAPVKSPATQKVPKPGASRPRQRVVRETAEPSPDVELQPSETPWRHGDRWRLPADRHPDAESVPDDRRHLPAPRDVPPVLTGTQRTGRRGRAA
jgi:hypothetical protein